MGLPLVFSFERKATHCGITKLSSSVTWYGILPYLFSLLSICILCLSNLILRTSCANSSVQRAELEQELDVKGDDVIKLICDPCLRKPRKTGVIDYRRAYDIWTIGALREGKVKLRAGFIPHDSSEEDLVLFFDLMWCPSLDEGPGPKEWRGGSLTLPLKFDRSSSCAIVVKEEVRDELPREAFVGSKEARADTPGPGTTVQHALPLRVGSGADIRPSPANPDTNNTFAGESNGDVEETRGGEIVNQRVGTRVVYSEPRFELKPESDTMANVLETPPESEPDVIVISD